MRKILKRELNSPTMFKAKLSEDIQNLRRMIREKGGIDFNDEELGDLLLSVCRSNDFDVIYQQGNKMFLNEDRILDWVEKKLLPNTVIVKLDDEDVIRLLIFCIEITYQMFCWWNKSNCNCERV